MLNRISILKDKMLSQPRFVSIEQALIITRTYQENEDKSIPYIMSYFDSAIVIVHNNMISKSKS